VRIRISGESVTFVAASPSQGWHAEVESYGPPTVEVKFEENKDHGGEIEFHAGFENGELVVTIHGD
jgi:hypothetical protein